MYYYTIIILFNFLLIDSVMSVSCSYDSKYLISGSGDYSIKVWNMNQLLSENKRHFVGHNCKIINNLN